MLKECLERCSVVELRAIARRQDVRLQSLLKADIISQVEPKIIQSIEVTRSSLPEAAQAALAALVDAGGSLPLSTIQARFGELRKAVAGGIESRQPWGDGMSTPLDILHTWGLVFASESSPGKRDLAVLPTEILERLRPAEVTRPRVFQTCSPPALPAGPSPYLCQDIMLLASALQEEPAVSASGSSLSQRDLLRLNSHLLSPEDIADAHTEKSARRLCFLKTLAEKLTLIAVRHGFWAPGPAFHSWLALSPEERRLSLVKAYSEPHCWSELDDVPAIRFECHPSPERLTEARRFVMRLLEEAEPEEWCSISSLIQAVRSRNSFLLRRPGDGSKVHCTQTERELTPRDWNMVEGAWIEAMVRGPLHWLGLLEHGRSRQGRLNSFRLLSHTPAYLAALTQDTSQASPQQAPPPQASPLEAISVSRGIGVVWVDQDLVVHVGHGIDFGCWFRIERFCELVERGSISRYKISPQKVRDLLQKGVSHLEILEDLGEGAPEAAVDLIADWAGRFGRLSLFRATILAADDADLMRQMRMRAEITSCLGKKLGEMASVVRRNKEEELVRLLLEQNEMPSVELPSLGPSAGASTLKPEHWAEIRKALTLWKELAQKNGAPGPSENTLRAVAAVAGPLAEPRAEPKPERQEAMELLEEAIHRRRSVTFDYQDPFGHHTGRLVVLPRSMGQQKGITYLLGYRKGGSNLDRFRLDCIQNVGQLENEALSKISP